MALGAKSELVADALGEFGNELRAFVATRVPQSDVDDVLQTAASRALERAESLRDPERARPWLFRLHRNVIVDTLRKRASVERLVDPGTALPDVADERAEPASCACSLAQAKRIKPAYAAVLTLVDVGHASVGEAATALGISVNNATVRLHRARKALRTAMLEHCGVQRPGDCIDCRCAADGCCPV